MRLSGKLLSITNKVVSHYSVLKNCVNVSTLNTLNTYMDSFNDELLV